MEYDNLHRGGVVSTLVDMDANNRLANVQSMLWQPHLVSYAIRSSFALHSVYSGLFLPTSGCYHQHPADADLQYGHQ
jgi:hypothetical protein